MQYFDEIRSAMNSGSPNARVVESLRRTYRRFLDSQTCSVNISLVGPFAQTDYLLKEHKADADIRRDINNLRVQFRKGRVSDPRYAASVLARFISCVCSLDVPSDLLYAASRPESSVQTEDTDIIGDRSTVNTGLSIAQYLRFVLDYWDETFLYGRCESFFESETVRVRYTDTHSYLRGMLYANAQFNLVRPRLNEDVIVADFLILEPDYLVNITSIARCFESYDESPYVYLLQKIQPSSSTQHTILGNFAGQLLDEELHNSADGQQLPYSESVASFFHHNASVLLTTHLPDDFHKQAQLQRDNIHRSIGEILPQSVSGFKKENVLLEPSFYSEMLGLQGRMDLLQTDMKVLIEQKSGKGAFVPGDTDKDTPKPVEQHYVQMLLYMLLVRYNFPEQYSKGVAGIQAFLLYSKYANSLVKLDFAPELVGRAMSIRNGIAWMETQLAEPRSQWNWSRLLGNLSSDQLNTKHLANRLWTDYKKPELDALLLPLHSASALEKAYYFRFLDFISREHFLSKVGNKNRQNAGFAAAWHDSLAEKRQSGNIYDCLTLESVSPLTFCFNDSDANDMANFRVGDIVVLYSYPDDVEPDIRRTMVHRATIDNITSSRISLTLRAEQTDPSVFLSHKDEHWAIEHDFMEASYSSLYRGMHSFLSAPKERRDLLLLQREAETDDSAIIKGEYGQFNDLMLRVKRAKDFFLIIGPPGTGKTSFGMLNTLKEELLEEDGRVLVVSYTNRAVDEICGKLIEDGIDFMRIGNESSSSVESRPYLFDNLIKDCRTVSQVRDMFLGKRVLCGTTSSMTAHLDMLCLAPFTLCIIDEASQILEPHLASLLSASCGTTPLLKRFVMIGDHKQLPAVVQQSVAESSVSADTETGAMLHSIGLTNCRNSLFERLLNRYRDNEDVVYMLTRQGRMHHDIADFPNKAFYQGRLTEVPLPHQTGELSFHNISANSTYTDIRDILVTKRVSFIDVPQPSGSVSDKVNQSEADIIARIVMCICQLEGDSLDDMTIGIIVPYRNQITTIRSTLSSFLGTADDALKEVIEKRFEGGVDAFLSRLAIDTVERFQGSQRRYIIYGFTVQQPYQLDFLTDNTFEEDGKLIDRKLNVAMTRAMEHLVFVGNKELLSRVPIFKQLIDLV